MVNWAEEVTVSTDGFAGGVGVGGGAEEDDHVGDVVGVGDLPGCSGISSLVDELPSASDCEPHAEKGPLC